MRTAFVACVTAVVLTGALYAQKHPNIELGFNPERLYQFSEMDSVNLFNGNLILQIPIGQSYATNASFGYRLTLVYNSKVWDLEKWRGTTPAGDYQFAEPNLRSNAGMGWRVSLGRIIPPGEGVSPFNETNHWKYETPAGAEHAFNSTSGAVSLAGDYSGLRLTDLGNNTRLVEFPNGEMHRFVKERGWWRLRKISDRFGNFLEVASDWFSTTQSDGREKGWILTDSLGRVHNVTFLYNANTSNSYDYGMHVDKIVMSTAATNSTGTSTYDFTYAPSFVLPFGCGHNPPPPLAGQPPNPTSIDVPALQKITLPDGTSFDFTYYSNTENCQQGALKSVELPTRGKILYKYQFIALPESFCFPSRWGATNPGVKTKTVWSSLPTPANPETDTTGAVTDYNFKLGPAQPYNQPEAAESCGGFYEQVPDAPESAVPQELRRWSRMSVLSPADSAGLRARTDSYFYTWTDLPAPQDPKNPSSTNSAETPIQFGQPITPGGPPAGNPDANVDDVDTSRMDTVPAGVDVVHDKHFLSTRSYEPVTSSTWQHVRSTYMRYSFDPGFYIQTTTPVLLSTLTHYPADTGCSGGCEVKTKSSQPDGVHKYGRSATWSNFPGGGDFSALKKYRTWTLGMMFAAGSVWDLGIHDGTERTEGNQTLLADYCFAADGFLSAVRTRANPTKLSATDLLTVFEKSATYGNVARELSYGGDGGGLSTSLKCLPLSGSPLRYLTRNTYTNGLMTKSEACNPVTSGTGCTSIVTKTDVDVHSTGAPQTSRDPAGVSTSYAYDTAGRLKTITSPGSIVSTFTYTAATSNSYASVSETTTDGASGPVLTEGSYRFDALGRPTRVTKSLPDQKFAAVETKYDALGRKSEVSQPFDSTLSPTAWTITNYDSFGRPKTITIPDGSVTSLTYTGDRVVTRTASAALAESGSTSVSVTEEYDAQRRLISVTENSGGTSATTTTGTAVKTLYGYDVGGRLVEVKNAGSSQTPRTFSYDLRGFLTAENHPESGMTTYAGHDARGHATSKETGGIPLTMTYDGAERLTAIMTGSKVLKAFTYGTSATAPDRSMGKLLTAMRRNELSSGAVINVTETYEYQENATTNPAGLLSKKSTAVVQAGVGTIQQFDQPYEYDKLQLLAKTVMPTCAVSACGSTSALTDVTYVRQAGYLTSVQNFGALSYYPSGMVSTVTHSSSPAAIDHYGAANGMARPSSIRFETPGTCALPARPVITAADSICPNATGTASVPAGSTVAWTISGGTLTSASNLATVTFQPNSGSSSVRLTVTATNSCGSSSMFKDIAVSANPAVPVMAAPSTVCPNTGGHTASVTQAPGMTYTWQISAGGTLSATTGSSVIFSVGSGSVTLTVTATSASCGQSVGTKTVATSASPTAELRVAGTNQTDFTIVRGSETSVELDLWFTPASAGPWEIVWGDGHTQTVTSDHVTRIVSPDRYTEYTLTSVKSGTCSGAFLGSVIYVRVAPPAPAWTRAVTQPNGKVSVSWAAVPGAALYWIYRATDYTATPVYVGTVNAPTTSWLDSSVTGAPVTYLYTVRSVDPEWAPGMQGESSTMSAFDHATAGDPLWAQTLEPGATKVKAADIQELRRAVDAFRLTMKYPALFAGAAAPTGEITAVDLNTLVAAFNEARRPGFYAPFEYGGVPAPQSSGLIRREHVQQLRDALH